MASRRLGPVAGDALQDTGTVQHGPLSLQIGPERRATAQGGASNRFPMSSSDEDDASRSGGAGSSSGGKGVKGRMSQTILTVLQTLLQHADSAQLSHLPRFKPKSGRTNPGHVVEALLAQCGFKWSGDGKRVWLDSNADSKLEWSKHQARTLKPAPQRPTLQSQLANMDLVHDAGAPASGAPAAQRAAADTVQQMAAAASDGAAGTSEGDRHP